MTLFTSTKEKKLWICAMAVVIAIYSTIFLADPIINIIKNDDVAAAFFLLSMALSGLMVLVYAIKLKPSLTELSLWLGILAVYIMLFLRLSVTERSHMLEYSVLAIIIHMAMAERMSKEQGLKVALIAILTTIVIGTLDELLQIFIPARVFDPVDIFFNSSAAILAITSFSLLRWIRNKL